MAGAYTALADDAFAPFYNPAGLAQLKAAEAGLSYARLDTGLSDGSQIDSSQFVYAQPVAKLRGTVAASWDRFNVSGLYGEQAFGLSYAGVPLRAGTRGDILLGLNLKYLERSFTPLPEAASACNGLLCGQGSDPALTGASRRGAVDTDLGALYRLSGGLQFGLAVDHALRPDVGFSETNRLERGYRMGIAYRDRSDSLGADIRMTPAPDGGMDRDYALGGERAYALKGIGRFSVRAGFAVGSREWRELSAGAGYAAGRMQVDYAFVLPLGAVRGQSGTHRVGLSWRFGSGASTDASTPAAVASSPRLRPVDDQAAVEQAVAEAAGEASSTGTATSGGDDGFLGIKDPALKGLYPLIVKMRLEDAREMLSHAAKDKKLNPALERLSHRLELASSYFPDLSGDQSKPRAVLSLGILRFLRARDTLAMTVLSYALSLSGGDPVVAHFIEDAERETGISADRMPERHNRGYVDELLYRAESAFSRGDLSSAERALRRGRLVEPTNPDLLWRLGALAYAQDRPSQAAPLLESARDVEITSKRRKRGADETASVLYQKALEADARGEPLESIALLLRVLQLDPANAGARRGLDQIVHAVR
jgi:hypothetical protein